MTPSRPFAVSSPSLQLKFIRLFLKLLGFVLALCAILVATAFIPAVQTWIVRMELPEHPGLQVSLGSVSAGLSGVDLEDVNVKTAGGVLTLPSLAAKLPIITAARDRQLAIRSLVAKGWTLDLSGAPNPKDSTASSTSAAASSVGAAASPEANANVVTQTAARVFRGVLRDLAFPCDVSVEHAELEGDVIVGAADSASPGRVHVIVRDGGMAAGRDGACALEASIDDPRLPGNPVTVKGQLVVAMKTPRSFERVGLKADVRFTGATPPDDRTWALDAAATHEATGEHYAVDLRRDTRRIAADARFAEAGGQLTGTWALEVRDSDLTPFFPQRPLPSLAASGSGTFDTSETFARVHVVGRASITAHHLGAIAPRLEHLEEIAVASQFDVVQAGHSLHVDRASITLEGAQPLAALRSLQPFDLDEQSGTMIASDPKADWAQGSIRGLNLTTLSESSDPLVITRGEAAGEFLVRAVDRTISLHSTTPFTVSNLSVQKAGAPVVSELSASLPLRANLSARGWQMNAAPLTLSSGARHLANVDVMISRTASAEHPIALAAKWSADLDALTASRAVPGLSWITARSATGDFTGTITTWAALQGSMVVTGHNATHTLTTKFQADLDFDGSGSFSAPTKIAFGPIVSDFSPEGSWRAGDRKWVELKLTGKNFALEHLPALAVPLAAAGGVRPPPRSTTAVAARPAAGSARDQIPFWGDWVGRISIDLDHVSSGGAAFNDVGGILKFSHGVLELAAGHGGSLHHRLQLVDGTIAFDPAAAHPYQAKATADAFEVDAAELFGEPKEGKEPLVEGRFTVDSFLAGEGDTLDDLIAHTRAALQLKSTNGIIRLLKTDVAESMPPPPPSPVADALIDAGAVVGKIFGAKSGSVASGENHVSAATEAVLDSTYELKEIGYDRFAFKAIWEPDRAIRFTDIVLMAAQEKLTGAGEVSFVKDRPIQTWPLHLELQLGVRGHVGDLFAKAGLFSVHKDEAGYLALEQPVKLGGTLEHVDDSAWRRLLVEAATRKPAVEKKGR